MLCFRNNSSWRQMSSLQCSSIIAQQNTNKIKFAWALTKRFLLYFLRFYLFTAALLHIVVSWLVFHPDQYACDIYVIVNSTLRRVRAKLAGVAEVMLFNIEGEGVKNVLIRFTWFVHYPKNAYSPGKYCTSHISLFDLIAPIPNLPPWVLLAQ